MTKTKKTRAIDFVQLSVAWVLFTAGGTVATLLANLFFPQGVVLGNYLLGPLASATHAMTAVSLIAVGLMPVVERVANDKKIVLTSTHLIILFWIVNSASVWLMGRWALVVGLGLGSWRVAVGLGFLLDLVQGGLMKHVVGKIKSA